MQSGGTSAQPPSPLPFPMSVDRQDWWRSLPSPQEADDIVTWGGSMPAEHWATLMYTWAYSLGTYTDRPTSRMVDAMSLRMMQVQTRMGMLVMTVGLSMSWPWLWFLVRRQILHFDDFMRATWHRRMVRSRLHRGVWTRWALYRLQRQQDAARTQAPAPFTPPSLAALYTLPLASMMEQSSSTHACRQRQAGTLGATRALAFTPPRMRLARPSSQSSSSCSPLSAPVEMA